MASPSVPARDPSVNHFDNGTVEQQIARATQCFIDHLEVDFHCAMDDLRADLGSTVGSPLEAAFAVWWGLFDELGLRSGARTILVAWPQYEVTVGGKKYRLDFALGAKGPTQDLVHSLDIGVELDGHEWHERTPKQVANRDRRDRDLQGAGWRVFHFSGSEFLRDPFWAIAAVRDAALDRAVEIGCGCGPTPKKQTAADTRAATVGDSPEA